MSQGFCFSVPIKYINALYIHVWDNRWCVFVKSHHESCVFTCAPQKKVQKISPSSPDLCSDTPVQQLVTTFVAFRWISILPNNRSAMTSDEWKSSCQFGKIEHNRSYLNHQLSEASINQFIGNWETNPPSNPRSNVCSTNSAWILVASADRNPHRCQHHRSPLIERCGHPFLHLATVPPQKWRLSDQPSWLFRS